MSVLFTCAVAVLSLIASTACAEEPPKAPQHYLVKFEIFDVSVSEMRKKGMDVEFQSFSPEQSRDFLDKLREARVLKVAAEPQIVVPENKPSQMISGGEFPIPVSREGEKITYKYLKFGTWIDLEVTPTGADSVSVDFRANCAELDNNVPHEFEGKKYPTAVTRTVASKVNTRLGDKVVSAGLNYVRPQAKPKFAIKLPGTKKAAASNELRMIVVLSVERAEDAIAAAPAPPRAAR